MYKVSERVASCSCMMSAPVWDTHAPSTRTAPTQAATVERCALRGWPLTLKCMAEPFLPPSGRS